MTNIHLEVPGATYISELGLTVGWAQFHWRDIGCMIQFTRLNPVVQYKAKMGVGSGAKCRGSICFNVRRIKPDKKEQKEVQLHEK